MNVNVTINTKNPKPVKMLNEEQKSFLIYIVDDQTINLNLISIFLKQKGFNIITETDIIKAIPHIEKTCPDLILLDVLMPKLNGFDAYNVLKSSPQTKDIPIIFITALDDTENKIKALDLGAVDYIIKPIHLPELLSRINSFLKIRNLTKNLQKQNQLLSD